MCVACSRKRGGEEIEEKQGEKRLRRDRQRQINSESGESYVHSFTNVISALISIMMDSEVGVWEYWIYWQMGKSTS
jgi:hypothetical protein